MNKNKILAEKIASSDVFAYAKFFTIFMLVVMLGVYAGNVFFGKYSLEVLLNLRSDKSILEKRIQQLKNENAALQKSYFELKQLDPDLK